MLSTKVSIKPSKTLHIIYVNFVNDNGWKDQFDRNVKFQGF